MKIYKYPSKKTFKEIMQRSVINSNEIFTDVRKILVDVKTNGDAAVKKYSQKFDQVAPSLEIGITQKEIKEAKKKIPNDLKEAINVAFANISKFHSSQLIKTEKIETTNGVICWQKYVPIENVGLYIPGGTAPLLSTLMMLAIPAKIAGCKNLVVCTPPKSDGSVDQAMLYLLDYFKIENAFKVGGAQAIAAMAYGTESISKMDKIFGPGNQYVTAAKQLVSLDNTAIDMPAGPSEVAIIADETANPGFVAADFLSQLEHGADSQAIIITDSKKLLDATIIEIEKQQAVLSRKKLIEKAAQKSSIVLLENKEDILNFVNDYAPEHLIISTKENKFYIENIKNAGSVFIGNYTPESAGDYASGTNHTLPTNGAAKAYSGLSTLSFMKAITFQEISKTGIKKLGQTIEILAETEQLQAHKNAVTIRLKQIENEKLS